MAIGEANRLVTIKRPEEIARMRHAGGILAEVLAALEGELRPDLTTAELDAVAERMIREAGAIPSFLGYGGGRRTDPFPASICVSINHEVVHGIPSPTRVLRDGDLVSVDVGVWLEGLHADSAATFPVGGVSGEAQRLLTVTQQALAAGIAEAATRPIATAIGPR